MKKMNLFILSCILTATVTFTACENDDSESNKAFVGDWQSNIYTSIDVTSGDTVSEKMVFNFSNNAFEDIIYQGDAGATTDSELQEVSGIKGTVDATDTTMIVEITEISLQGGPFTNKESDPDAFATKFDQSIGLLLFEEFEAEYSISGNNMQLILPIKMMGQTVTDTLHLSKP
jgi:hypothetical protein